MLRQHCLRPTTDLLFRWHSQLGNGGTRRSCRQCQSTPERKDKKKSQHRDSAKPLAAYEDVTEGAAGQVGRDCQTPLASAVQRVNAGGCPFVSSGPLADGQGRVVFTGSSAGESIQDAIRHCEGGGFAGQERKSVACGQTGAGQCEIPPGRLEVQPAEAHPRSGTVGSEPRLARGFLHGRRLWWLAGGWIFVLALCQQCVVASLQRGRGHFGCSQTRTGGSWLGRTGGCAHRDACAIAAGRRRHLISEADAAGTSYPCPAGQVSSTDTFFTRRTRGRFCVGRPTFRQMVVDRYRGHREGRQRQRLFCMAEGTPPGT